jgi:hypothetical protein
MAGEAPQIVDNIAASEIYAGRIISAGFDGAAVVVTLGNLRAGIGGRPEDAKVHVSGRLALSPSAAGELVRLLRHVLQALSTSSVQSAIEADRPIN